MPSPVVLVPGLGGSAREWAEVVEALARLGVTASAVELPGIGSRRDEDFGWGSAVEAVSSALRDLPREAGSESQPLVVGRALGGHVAIAAAVASDIPVAGVIAAGIGTETLGWLVDSYRISSAVSQLLPDRGQGVSGLAGSAFAGSAGDGGTGMLTSAALDEVQRFDVRAALRSLDAPFVLVNGSRDRMVLQERALLRAAGRSRLERVRGAAFSTRQDAPERLVAIIAEAAGAAAGPRVPPLAG